MTWPVFYSGPRNGASGENVSPPTTGLQKKVNNGHAFLKENTFFSIFFLNEPIAGTPRPPVKTFTQISEGLTAYGPMSSHF